MSIRLRLTLWYSGILTITLLFFGLTLYLFLYVKMNNDIDVTLVSQGTEVKKEIRLVRFMDLAQIQLPDLRDFKSSGIYLQSINTNRQLSRSSNLTEIIDFSPEAFDKAVTLKEDTFETVSLNGFDLRIYYTPMLVNKQVVGVLQVATQLNGIQQFLNNLVFILSILIVLTILIAATVGWFLARKALNPIEYVIEAAGQIEKGADLERRLSYNGPPDEIGRLTDTINGMLSRIQTIYSELSEAYRAQRRLVSDASHELRTPLTTIRGNIELLEKMWKSTKAPREATNEPDNMGVSLEAMQDISSEAERMSRLVNDLLSLARADAGYKMSKEPVELRPLVEEVARKAQFLPRKVEWDAGDLDPLEHVIVEGNKDSIQQLLFILIENAFKYTEQGYVKLDVQRTGELIGIRISDSGIGMNNDEVQHIFERFYRADPSRGKTSGIGLGLSIAKNIIDEHNGSIEVITRKGTGTTFIIWLPVYYPSEV